MQPSERDIAFLWDMLGAARDLSRLIAAIESSERPTDWVTQLAIERLTTNLGESARRVPPKIQEQHPQIP